VTIDPERGGDGLGRRNHLLDAIAFMPVPEPSTMALLCSAALAALFKARRRK
jgi:hypothetical protein